MSKKYNVAFVFAHPDDESFMAGGTIRKLADAGHRVSLYTATSGDAGKSGLLKLANGETLAARRREELSAACAILGIADLEIGPYADKGLSGLDPSELTGVVSDFLSRREAEIVVTFPQDGFSGHPDHAAIHRATLSAFERVGGAARLYLGGSPAEAAIHPITTVVDIGATQAAKREALLAHESQIFSVRRVYPGIEQGAPQAISKTEAFILACAGNEWWPRVRETSLLPRD